ncbi:TetR family transcriptional regulator C-terminal domain-containing protein [Cryptosporangium aurantiacum]|uniref:Transcriptional regulator, TetR family n=1 Tax=Cryptosporangium aurantiacum TaxID=134849 RepID=A0A1M7RP67_9ACTN|nr:TetR family transcriptional regulator C-terminal domain-containing protein [Cryptosporangium aurantiacum]SHN48125.1 transcriptional regulator, TetR family [Cryptosporangium aurantiacum]
MTTKRRGKSREIARSAISVLSEHGVRNARLADIGAGLGMTGAHLLYYFESKTDLFMAALRIVESDLRERAVAAFAELATAQERWRWLVDAAAPSGLRDSNLMMWLEAWSEAVHDPAVHKLITELEDGWQGLVREVLEYGVATGELEPDLDVETFVEGFSALLDGLTIRAVVGYRPVDKGRIVEICNTFAASQLRWNTPAAV